MAIETNEQREAPRPSSEQPQAAASPSFTMPGAAPSGELDLLSLTAGIGIPRVDPSVGPYLDEVLKLTNEYLKTVELVRFPRRDNTYVLTYTGEDSVLSCFVMMFVSQTDGVGANMSPASNRLGTVVEELRDMFPGKQIRLVDQRVMLGGYAPEMARTKEMAGTIVRAFNVTTKAAFKEATIRNVATVEFSPEWNLSQARAMADSLSPHGVRSRMDLGMVLNAKIQPNTGREFKDVDTQYRPIGVIGGYVDFLEKEPVQMPSGQVEVRYQPIFNVTVIQSEIPLEGMVGLLLAAIAPNIYSSLWWLNQWNDFAKDQPNPGFLEADPAKPGQPIFLENKDDLADFARAKFAVPEIVMQMQDGRDSIPGLYRMFSENANDRTHFLQRVMHFLEVNDANVSSSEITRTVEYRYDGAYGDAAGVLRDSREVDYLSIAAKAGFGAIGPDMRRTLLTINPNRPDLRAELVKNFTGSFNPYWLTMSNLVNANFVRWLAETIKARGVSIIDPSYQAGGNSFSSLRQGFGNGANMPSIISSGIMPSRFNLSSNWNRWGN